MEIYKKLCKKLKEMGVESRSGKVLVLKFPIFAPNDIVVSQERFQEAINDSILSDEARKLVKTLPAYVIDNVFRVGKKWWPQRLGLLATCDQTDWK